MIISPSRKHDNTNLLVIVTSGGFKHGARHAFKTDNNALLCKLFVTLFKYIGVEAGRFGSSANDVNQLLAV